MKEHDSKGLFTFIYVAITIPILHLTIKKTCLCSQSVLLTYILPFLATKG